MESSEAEVRDGYRRFFAWTAAIAFFIVIGLVAAEVSFPESLQSGPSTNIMTGALSPDLYDFQLLLLVVAMVACLASIAGLVIVALLDSIETRKQRRRRAIEARLRRTVSRSDHAAAPSPEPRNARLRALRDVVHQLEKT